MRGTEPVQLFESLQLTVPRSCLRLASHAVWTGTARMTVTAVSHALGRCDHHHLSLTPARTRQWEGDPDSCGVHTVGLLV